MTTRTSTRTPSRRSSCATFSSSVAAAALISGSHSARMAIASGTAGIGSITWNSRSDSSNRRASQEATAVAARALADRSVAQKIMTSPPEAVLVHHLGQRVVRSPEAPGRQPLRTAHPAAQKMRGTGGS